MAKTRTRSLFQLKYGVKFVHNFYFCPLLPTLNQNFCVETCELADRRACLAHLCDAFSAKTGAWLPYRTSVQSVVMHKYTGPLSSSPQIIGFTVTENRPLFW